MLALVMRMTSVESGEARFFTPVAQCISVLPKTRLGLAAAVSGFRSGFPSLSLPVDPAASRCPKHRDQHRLRARQQQGSFVRAFVGAGGHLEGPIVDEQECQDGLAQAALVSANTTLDGSLLLIEHEAGPSHLNICKLYLGLLCGLSRSKRPASASERANVTARLLARPHRDRVWGPRGCIVGFGRRRRMQGLAHFRG